MNFSSIRIVAHATLAALILSILIVAPLSFAQKSPGVSPGPSATPAGAMQFQRPPPKPIPATIKITIVATVVVVGAVVLFFSMRAWRAGNLFDREYRFPPVTAATVRLGGQRSGGCMATINFGNRGDPIRESGSKDI
jgi:hypothetical protein